MKARAVCKSFDGSFWDAPIPDTWTCKQDMAQKNYPHVFESRSGSRLTVLTWGQRNAAPIRAWDDEDIPADIQNASHRHIFLSVLRQARLYRTKSLIEQGTATMRGKLGKEPDILRHDLGELIGFSYEMHTQQYSGWYGEFCAGKTELWVTFCAPHDFLAIDSATAQSILAAIRFHGSPSTSQLSS